MNKYIDGEIMNELNLSKRLTKVVSKIPKGSKIADIGSDHAYLPCYAVKHQLSPFAIAGEVNEGPFVTATRQVSMSGLTDFISVRKGDGLEVICENEVDIIIICGMGGSLIREILEKGKTKLKGTKRLLLQPNVGAIKVREWLIDNGWELIDEEIIEEDEKIYEIIVAEKGDPQAPYKEINKQAGLLLGPFLMLKRDWVFRMKWSGELKKWKKILNQMQDAKDTGDLGKNREEIKRKVKLVEEVLDEKSND